MLVNAPLIATTPFSLSEYAASSRPETNKDTPDVVSPMRLSIELMSGSTPSLLGSAKPLRLSNVAAWNLRQCAADPHRFSAYAVHSKATCPAGVNYALRERR